MTDEYLPDSDYIFNLNSGVFNDLSSIPKGTKGYFTAYPVCDFCHEQSAFVMEFPYGSAYDGWVMCVECIKKIVEPAIVAWVTR